MADQSIVMASPQVIDIAEFTRHGRTLAGEVKVRDLTRLQDLIVSSEKQLHYEVRGGLSARRESQITCIIRGSVSLECQRCAGAFDHELAIRSTLVFVGDESQLPAIEDEDEEVDYL